MRGTFTVFNLFTILLWSTGIIAQTIQGQIIDLKSNEPLEDVAIRNLHEGEFSLTDEEGKFSIFASRGHLIEFRKPGFKVIRVRLPQGNLPSFFKVVMDKEPEPIETIASGRAPHYAADSKKYYTLYKKELEYPRMSVAEKIRSPFSAMSRQNQQIWAFQQEFIWFQQHKYIDYIFNEEIIASITGLQGDSALAYMRLFRPSYEMVREMDEYTYYQYLQSTVQAYRLYGPRARMGRIRGTQ